MAGDSETNEKVERVAARDESSERNESNTQREFFSHILMQASGMDFHSSSKQISGDSTNKQLESENKIGKLSIVIPPNAQAAEQTKPATDQSKKPAPEQKEQQTPNGPKETAKPSMPKEPAKPAEQNNKPPAPAEQKPIPLDQLAKPTPIEAKEKPGEQVKPKEITGPFTDIKPEEAARLLTNQSGKDLPPIAERFEQEALKQLGPEATPTMYVSKDANDKNIPAGAKSYRSISEAVKNAPAGSVIQVLPGIYNERVTLGERNSNITIQTDRQNPAVLNGGGFNVVSHAHDISIRNFEVKNFSAHGAGIRVDGQNIRNVTIAGNNVHSAKNAEGIAVYGRPGEPVTGINVIGNRIHDLKLSELEALPINGNVDGFKVIGNSGYRLNNLFIDVIGGEGVGGGKDQARNGVIAHNFADGISSKNNPSYGDYSAGGIYSDGGKNLEIYGNYVRGSDFGIEVGSEHYGLNSNGVNVHNNIFERSHTVWLKLGYKGGVENSTIKNNLVLKNGVSNIEREGPVKSSTKVQDNIGAKDRNNVTKMPSLMMGPVLIK